jgi:hypothetical protein
MRLPPTLIAAVMVGLSTSRASAGPTAAEALFQEGRQLLEEGHVDEACLRLAESYAQEPASGTLLNLARCHQTQGKIATAWPSTQLRRDSPAFKVAKTGLALPRNEPLRWNRNCRVSNCGCRSPPLD